MRYQEEIIAKLEKVESIIDRRSSERPLIVFDVDIRERERYDAQTRIFETERDTLLWVLRRDSNA